MALLSQQDHDLVTAAVTAAERQSDGEIVTIVAPRSDAYHDVALHYAVLAMLVVPVKLALLPQGWIDRAAGLLLGWNPELSRGTLMVVLFVLLALAHANGGRLATMDQKLAAEVVPGGSKALELIQPG